MNPYPPKKCHRGHLVSQGGKVSALCYSRPRPIPMSRETWTLQPTAVTCKACLAKMAEQAAAKGATP